MKRMEVKRVIKGNVERVVPADDLERFLKAGYCLVGEDGSVKDPPPPRLRYEDINGMSLAALRAMAKERGIQGDSLKKSELLELLT